MCGVSVWRALCVSASVCGEVTRKERDEKTHTCRCLFFQTLNTWAVRPKATATQSGAAADQASPATGAPAE